MIPSLHASGQWRIRLRGKDFYLGKNKVEAFKLAEEIVSLWEQNNCELPVELTQPSSKAHLLLFLLKKVVNKETILDIINESGMSLKEVADASGYTRGYLYDLGKRFNPVQHRLKKLASVLGVDIERLRAAIA